MCRIRRLLLALPLALLGCPGDAVLPPRDGPHATDARVDAGDRGRRPETNVPGPDAAPCAAFAKEGQSCAGGLTCPSGMQPANLDGKGCACYVPCNPSETAVCKPAECDRRCVQLVDSGKPLPGQGVCLLDTGAIDGEPCAPAACKVGLYCVAQTATLSFCRHTCATAEQCNGYKMVCVALTSSSVNVCIPGGATVGPKAGEPCAGPNEYCISDAICAPTAKVCAAPCNPAGAPCASGACTKLVDPASGMVVGYGCL